MRHQIYRTMALGMTLAGALALAGQSAEAALMINEVLFNPGGLDANGDGVVSASGDEFVELVNTDTLPILLNGWSLKDALSTRHAFGPTAIVPGLGFLVVFGGGTPTGIDNAFIASTGTLSLNNSGDTVSLLDSSSALVDQLIYNQSLSGVSLTRFPDGAGSFVNHHTVSALDFSPGLTTEGARQLATPEQHPDPIVPEPSTWWLFGMPLTLAMLTPWRPRLRIS